MDTVWPTSEPPIPARSAPEDFPGGLPDRPPTLDQTYQLVELWDNVEGMARLRWGERDGVRRCEYMVWFLSDGREYRVRWDDEKGVFRTRQRSTPNSGSR